MDRIDRFVLDQAPWEKLPVDVKQALGNSKSNWSQAVLDRSLRFQLRWTTCPLVKELIKDEKQYYAKMIEILQKSLLVCCLSCGFLTASTWLILRFVIQLYPYHLSDVLVKGLGLTPFKFYLEMMLDVLLSGTFACPLGGQMMVDPDAEPVRQELRFRPKLYSRGRPAVAWLWTKPVHRRCQRSAIQGTCGS
jgi:hypothetical protein